MFYFLIYLFAITLPFQETTTIGGRGIVFYHVMAFFLYALFVHHRNFIRLLKTKFFVFCTLFLLVGLYMESFHPYSNYGPIARMSVMFLGALSVGACLNSRKRVQHVVNVFVISGFVYLIPILVLGRNQLGSSSGINAFDILNQFFGSTRNPNDIGCVLAFLFVFLYIKFIHKNYLTSLFKKPYVYLICAAILVALFILDARSGFLFILVTTILYLYYFRQLKLGRIGFLAIVIFLVSFANLSYIQERFLVYFDDSHQGIEEVDARGRVYNASMEAIPEVFWTGVGYGNFISVWGFNTGFVSEKYRQGVLYSKVQHAHNTFFQIVINWGLPGIVFLALIFWSIKRGIPSRASKEPQDHYVFILALTYFFLLFLSHYFESKENSLIFAVLVSRNILWK
jgi:O-antigen ligase